MDSNGYIEAIDITKAVALAKWLIEKQKVKRKTAYIISARKFHIPTYDVIRHEYQKVKEGQEQLFLI